MRKFIGKEVDVLIEGNLKDSPNTLEGVADNYLPVRLAFKPGLKNKIIRVRIEGIVDGSFIGVDFTPKQGQTLGQSAGWPCIKRGRA